MNNKKNNKKITFEVAESRFNSQGRTDIVLCKDGFNGFHCKSKFYDLVAKDYFWSIPYDVYKHKIVHVSRKSEKRKKTIKKKYGVNNLHEIKEYRDKIIHTNKKKYGVDYPFQSKAIREKQKNSCNEKFGVDNPFKLREYQEKAKKTISKKYGVTNIGEIKSKKIKDCNLTLRNWLKKQKDPKPSMSYLGSQFYKKNIVTVFELENFVEKYRNNITRLEQETEILFEIKHYNKSPKQIKSMCRPDFKLNDQLYLNVDGLYWHSELQKNKWYHYNLRKEFEDAGLRLFQFREDEIYQKPIIVKSIVNNALGKTKNRIFARKCSVKKIKQKEAKNFLDENHLMGSTNAKHVGLFHNDKLVSILSWKCRKNICKIERFCSKLNTNVVGGFSKLLFFLERNCLENFITEIHNWVDLRYGTGEHLINKEFILEKETLGWKWADGVETYNRLRCRANMDERKLTQKEHADELGWFKIYDAGQRLWIKK